MDGMTMVEASVEGVVHEVLGEAAAVKEMGIEIEIETEETDETTAPEEIGPETAMTIDETMGEMTGLGMMMTMAHLRKSGAEDSSPKPPNGPPPEPNAPPPPDPKADGEIEEGEDMEEDEMQMMAAMGFGGFDSTKGKSVNGNQQGAANVKKQRTWRQYMNRKGGFNRPLDKVK
ncbi:hypothetical protein OPQ81_006611 [Rhizoctonia solani]|nr:hypothetical protein OPQ81_006611 [Rhizoctonia solani]